MAQFGAPPSTMTMDSQDSLPSATGTGAVHTVLVAPTGAGLRYVPFALNASVGDTVRYVWTTPNNHTATLSSALAVCNKSGIADERDFVSGVRNASQGVQVCESYPVLSHPRPLAHLLPSRCDCPDCRAAILLLLRPATLREGHVRYHQPKYQRRWCPDRRINDELLARVQSQPSSCL